MILSASRRTDIPCYYAQWFMNRIRSGYVLTRNPMNPSQLSRLSLSPDIVDCIVFWTKDPQNIMPCLPELDQLGYHYYFQFTLTPYDQTLEQGLRAKAQLEDTFIQLSTRIGRERVVWRYDPIILNDQIDIAFHKAEFRRMCETLSPYTDTVVISFVDLYAKLKTTLLREITNEEIAELSRFIGRTAKEFGLHPAACCEQEDLTQYGIARSSCIDQKRIEKIIGCPLQITPDKNQREACGCCASVDIGAYNTCLNGCVYCYANTSRNAILRQIKQHDPKGELLIGGITEAEQPRERKAASNKVMQTSLF